MATKTWIGNAHDVKQISTITVALTWAAADTAQITINTKDIIVTIGATGTSTANVAIAIKEAIMSATRLDATGTTDATSNVGGQEFGEFSEFTATVSGSVVTCIATTAGKPFTMTVTETTAGTGTATGATTQAATGRNYWDNVDNWDTASVPASNDIVVFRDSDVSCKYGLPNATLEVTIQQWMSYTGEVGLPATNADVIGKPYREYRQRYVRLDGDGTGTNIAHRFGLGKDGAGCRLINLKHSALKCSPIVYNTGTPLASRAGTKALNICCTENTSTLNILNGSVDWGSQDGDMSAFVTVIQTSGDTRGIDGMYTAISELTVSGGACVVGGTGAITSIYCRGGTLRLENQTGTITTLYLYPNGTCDYSSTATITSMRLLGGTFDARNDAGGFTITTTNINAVGSKFLDPYSRLVIGTSFNVFHELSADIQLGGSASTGITLGV